MAQNTQSAWFLSATLLITAASALAGCASAPSAGLSSADKAGTSKDIDGSIDDSRPNADVRRVLRDALVDLDDAGISFNILQIGPILLVGPMFKSWTAK
jgi:hypothetical protein